MQLQSKPIFEITQSYLQKNVALKASKIDRDFNSLQEALMELGNFNLLALKAPKKWGGAELEESEFRQLQEMIPRYSGALAFLQTQHQSAASFLAKSENTKLQQNYLPRMGKGEVLVGVGFSQLRRQGKPMMRATRVENGYLLEGKVPWVTGYNIFDEFIIGATLPNRKAVYGMIPFQNREEGKGKITFSSPMQLAAMASTNTVSATLNTWFLPNELVLFEKEAGAIHDSDKKNVLNHSFFSLGCARAGLDILERQFQKKQLPFLEDVYNALNEELNECRSQIYAALSSESHTFEQKLSLRGWAIDLGGRCAQAAVTASSGAANLLQHSAQRVYGEALVFRVSGQTTDVMEATLRRLVV